MLPITANKTHAQTSFTSDSSVTTDSSVTSDSSVISDYSFTDTSEPIPDFTFAKHVNKTILSITANMPRPYSPLTLQTPQIP